MTNNINEVTVEQVGKKYIEWLQLERKYMAIRDKMYYADFDDYEYDNEAEREPCDKSELLALVHEFHKSIKVQQEAYSELIEVSDLYIAKELL